MCDAGRVALHVDGVRMNEVVECDVGVRVMSSSFEFSRVISIAAFAHRPSHTHPLARFAPSRRIVACGVCSVSRAVHTHHTTDK